MSTAIANASTWPSTSPSTSVLASTSPSASASAFAHAIAWSPTAAPALAVLRALAWLSPPPSPPIAAFAVALLLRCARVWNTQGSAAGLPCIQLRHVAMKSIAWVHAPGMAPKAAVPALLTGCQSRCSSARHSSLREPTMAFKRALVLAEHASSWACRYARACAMTSSPMPSMLREKQQAQHRLMYASR